MPIARLISSVQLLILMVLTGFRATTLVFVCGWFCVHADGVQIPVPSIL